MEYKKTSRVNRNNYILSSVNFKTQEASGTCPMTDMSCDVM